MRNLQLIQLTIFVWTILLAFEALGCFYAFRKISREHGRANRLFAQQLLSAGADAAATLALVLLFAPVLLWQAPPPARWVVAVAFVLRGLGSLGRMVGQLRITSFLLGFTNGNSHKHPHRHMDKERAE